MMNFCSLAAIAFFVSGALAQFTINTPTNAVVCQPLLLSWSGGTAPYFLSVLPGSQPSAAALVDLGQQTGTSVTWTVNVAAGTSIGLSLRDSSGQVAQTAPFTVNSGTNTTCVGQTASTSAGPSGIVATPPASSAGSSPSATSPSSAGASAASKAASASTAASATGSKNAAPTHGAQIGAAGLIGAAVMAVLA